MNPGFIEAYLQNREKIPKDEPSALFLVYCI